MRLRNTAILALLLAVLGGYLYFVESKKIAKEAVKQKLIDLNPDDATAITLHYPDREIGLEKGDGGWRLTKPVAAAADEVTVKNLLRAIADAEVTKTLDDAPTDLAPFGLTTPAVTVTVTAKGQPLPALKLGKTTAVSNSTYVQRAEQPKIYLTGAGFHSGMDKQPKDLRDKKVVDFKDDEITRIALRGPQGAVALAKQDGAWTITQPAAYKADANAVRALLSTVRNLRATDFANDAPADADLVTYGLDNPDRELVLRAGEGATVTLLLGKESEQGLYAKAGDKPTVFVVGKWVTTDLSKGVNDLRDKSLLSFDPAAVTAIEVGRGDGEQFTLARAGDTWSLSGVEGVPNAGVVDPFVAGLSHLSGNQIVADAAPDLGQYGLAAPAVTITVQGKDGAGLGTVRFGSYTPNPPATEYTAKRDDDATVFQLRDFQFKQLDKKKADFTAAPAPPPAADDEE
jgi:hypothetical protein